MKAIKLASIFAVSAVAAAVSTTTMAAEPVFSGTAGIEYTSYEDYSSADGTALGEVEINVDNGIVFAEIELDAAAGSEVTVDMEELYVKQGAVSFGRFDGSVASDAFMGMDEIGYTGLAPSTDDTGIRYSVSPELTVALEATQADDTVGAEVDSDIGVALSYITEMDGFSFGVSGGSVGDATSLNVGVQTTIDALTLSANYGTGTDSSDADISEMGFSVAFAATEALTLTLQYANETEAETDGTYFIAEYAVGDLTYYVENYAGDYTTEATIVGVTASF